MGGTEADTSKFEVGRLIAENQAILDEKSRKPITEISSMEMLKNTINDLKVAFYK